jgi:glycosyltransferase involved in cell wall biosynthesis
VADKISICMPVYNGSSVILETIKYILNQSFSDFELVISDDNSSDDTVEVLKSIKDSRIKVFVNPRNLGYARNLEACRMKCLNEIIFLMGQDDILAKDALLKTYNAFRDPEVGALTRPYFWFYRDIKKPVRAKDVFDAQRDAIVSISDGKDAVIKVFRSLDQLSGLAFRRAFMDRGFHEDIFPAHVYPFAAIFKKHKIVYLKDYTIAVRILTSQTRSLSKIYEKSPMQSWVDMFNTVFKEDDLRRLRKRCISDFVAVNFVGLVQIKNYGRFRYLLREVFLLIKYRWLNIIDPRFWFFSLGTALIPRRLLIPLVDIYKNKILSKSLSAIEFEYE